MTEKELPTLPPLDLRIIDGVCQACFSHISSDVEEHFDAHRRGRAAAERATRDLR